MKRFLSAGVAGGSVIASYESDVVAWASEQASLIRAGRFELLDREHVAEEIEAVARSEQRELASRMAVVLAHLLKWQYQVDRRGASWERIILAQRKEIAYGLHDTPSLGPKLQEARWLEMVWAKALAQAVGGEYELAHLAYEIERIDLDLAGGKQDQYSASFGGFNFMEFGGNGHVLVNPLRMKPWIVSELESSLLLFFTGVSRESAHIIDQQVRNIREGARAPIEALFSVKEEAVRMKAALLKGDFDSFVESMRASWVSKKRTASSISNAHIERIYDDAMQAGARAGKVSGAGGGGFMMFFVAPEAKPLVARALAARAGQVFSCHFTKSGSQAWRVR